MSETPLLRVPSGLKNLATIRQFIEETAAALHVDVASIADMVQAVDEAATNITLHAYHGGPGMIEIEAIREGEWLVVRLRDFGPPFDPTGYPEPDLTLPLEKRQPGGLGIHLMRAFTDRMAYRLTPGGANELTLVRRASAAQPGDVP